MRGRPVQDEFQWNRRSTSGGRLGRCSCWYVWFGPIPLLSKGGAGAQRPGWSVQSRVATLQMSAKRSLLIGTFVFEQTAPALATRGLPRLTKAGNGLSYFGQHSLFEEGCPRPQ